MPIVFASLVPHPAILIPSIGKENISQLKKTADSYAKLEESLNEIKPDTIIFISPHGDIRENSFVINSSPSFSCQFKDFGDLSVNLKIEGDVGLANKIKEGLEQKINTQITSDENLDYGSGIPFYLLAKNLNKIKIIPIYYSEMSLKDNFNFGQLLKKELVYNQEKIAIIASGDLSHKLSKKSPAGYSSKAKKFDQKVIDSILKNDYKSLIEIDKKTLNDVCECGLKSILILMGVMDEIKNEPQLLSYENPLGVGYAVVKYNI